MPGIDLIVNLDERSPDLVSIGQQGWETHYLEKYPSIAGQLC